MKNDQFTSYAWYRSLGKKGVDWVPTMVIYNSGRSLYSAYLKDPYSPIPLYQSWTWLKYREYNHRFQSRHSRLIQGLVLSHNGHIGNTNEGCDKSALIVLDDGFINPFLIHPKSMIHVIESIGGYVFHQEFHPISWKRISENLIN